MIEEILETLTVLENQLRQLREGSVPNPESDDGLTEAQMLQKLKAFFDGNKMSQKELADATGISSASISNALAGRQSCPAKAAEFLGYKRVVKIRYYPLGSQHAGLEQSTEPITEPLEDSDSDSDSDSSSPLDTTEGNTNRPKMPDPDWVKDLKRIQP